MNYKINKQTKMFYVFFMILFSLIYFNYDNAFAKQDSEKMSLMQSYKINCDFNGDGKKEELLIKFYGEKTDVDDRIYQVKFIQDNKIIFSNDIFSLCLIKPKIVDINKNDSQKEIALESIVDGNDSVYFYTYDGNNIVYINRIYGLLSQDSISYDPIYAPNIKISGNGMVYQVNRADLLLTFKYYVPYKLDAKSNKLKEIPSDTYMFCSPIQSTVKQNIYTYSNIHEKKADQLLKTGDQITFYRTDGKKWVGYKTKNGQKGWILCSDNYKIPDSYINANDYFSNVFFYD